MKHLTLCLVALFLAACDNNSSESSHLNENKTILNMVDTRSFTVLQLTTGQNIFEKNCQVCHGVKARGLVKDWQQADANGKYPAPPLDGSAHAWHHDFKTLLRTVNRGGIPLGGTMPSFKTVLSDDEKSAVLGYIISLWPEETYNIWAKRNG